MEKPDAVISDLDGTLLNAQQHCSLRNRQALERCVSHGIPVIIATSRAPRSVRQLLGAAFLHQYSHVVLNGALAWAVPPFQGRYQRPLATPVALHIVAAVRTRHATARIAVELDGERFATHVPRDALTLWQRFAATPDLVTPLEALEASEVLKVTVDAQDTDLTATGASRGGWRGPVFRALARSVGGVSCALTHVVGGERGTVLKPWGGGGWVGVLGPRPGVRGILCSARCSGTEVRSLHLTTACSRLPPASARASLRLLGAAHAQRWAALVASSCQGRHVS